jgi:TetR/AcrR family transcriptional regulator, transcriptional repressor for nem operon
METKERLVEATRSLLWERGYVGTSPGAILRRSGVGHGSLYHHFTGKPAIALVAIERSSAELAAAADSCLWGPGSALDRIAVWLLRPREVLRGCPIGRLSQDPDVVADEVLRRPVGEGLARLEKSVADVILEGQHSGEIRIDVDAADLAAAVVAALQGGYVLARAAASQEPFDRAVRGVLALVDGLRTGTASME